VAPATIEQRYTQFLFQSLDLLRDRWLCEQEFFGGAAEVQMLSDTTKDSNAEVLDHGRFLL
jgi:hypothetical protein